MTRIAVFEEGKHSKHTVNNVLMSDDKEVAFYGPPRIFLDANMHLYVRSCLSICRSVRCTSIMPVKRPYPKDSEGLLAH